MRYQALAAITLMMASTHGLSAEVKMHSEPARVVKGFLDEVRSGRDPDAVTRYFAPSVRAHQVTSEKDVTVIRTPAEYAAHVREFISLFGQFTFRVEEMMTQGDRVYVRWRQTGHHIGSFDREAPTGAPLTDISSAVYRVENGRIVEYWIQTDRKGLELQLESIAGRKQP